MDCGCVRNARRTLEPAATIGSISTMTVEEEKTFWRVTRWALRNWEFSPDYEDILSEALLEAWR